MQLRLLRILGFTAALFGGCVPPEDYCFEGRQGRHCQAEPDAGSTEPDAGSTEPDAGPAELGTCGRGDIQPCGAFVTGSGAELTLGRYGAVMERNVGKGFENTFDPSVEAICEPFVAAFGADPQETAEWIELGDLDPRLYTVYRPANWISGESYPIVTWGNGTCMQPETYGALLRYVASQGFFVVAANSRFVGSGTEQRRALDFALAANQDSSSPYYGRLDTSKIAAIGHSQGGLGTVNAAVDARVDTAVLFNAGSNVASKPFLLVTGDNDVGGLDASDLAALVDGAPEAAYLFYHMIPVSGGVADGYLTLILQPERVTGPTAAWLRYRLEGDASSRSWFVGDDCRLCDSAAQFEYGQHGLD